MKRVLPPRHGLDHEGVQGRPEGVSLQGLLGRRRKCAAGASPGGDAPRDRRLLAARAHGGVPSEAQLGGDAARVRHPPPPVLRPDQRRVRRGGLVPRVPRAHPEVEGREGWATQRVRGRAPRDTVARRQDFRKA